MAKSVAAAIRKESALAGTLFVCAVSSYPLKFDVLTGRVACADLQDDSLPIVSAIGRAIWRSLPVIDSITQQAALTQASLPTGLGLSHLSRSNGTSIGRQTTGRNIEEVDAARDGFQKLESNDWGAHAVKELLSSIRHQIGGTVSMLRILAVLSVFGEPRIPASFQEPEPHHIEGTVHEIQDGLHPLDGHAVQTPLNPDSVTKMLVESFSDVWSEAAKGEAAECLRIVRSIMEATLGSQLQPLLFGARIAAECLEDFTNLKKGPWGYAWSYSIASMRESEKTVRILLALESDLSYGNVRNSLAEFEQSNRDFDNVCDAILQHPGDRDMAVAFLLGNDPHPLRMSPNFFSDLSRFFRGNSAHRDSDPAKKRQHNGLAVTVTVAPLQRSDNGGAASHQKSTSQDSEPRIFEDEQEHTLIPTKIRLAKIVN
ncbi:hypothetical protein DFH09DRAFT_1107165 [Mycena vulgaris]|nr:hypothetical protein DFH09DRAFT_1107165 [Mycena vulgaris]